MLSETELARIRSFFPHIATGKLYFNHAASGPLSSRVVNAVAAHLRARSRGDIDTYPNDAAMVEECRVFVQRLIHADSPGRIALMPNTTDGINVVASGMAWKTGDRVLLNRLEFPANVWPFLNLRRRGVEIDFIEGVGGMVTTEMIAAAITPKTRLVALSAVQFLTGHRADLAAIGELCRQRGIVFAVDGIQAVGAAAIDVQRMHIDALSAGGQKWQMAPHGTGFVYVNEALQEQIQQSSLGWLSVQDPWNFTNFDQPLAETARRYESGSLPMASLWGLHASLTTLLEVGPEELERRVLSLTGTLIDDLQKIDGIRMVTPTAASARAGIVTIVCPSGVDAHRVLQMMADRKLIVALREGLLRFSPHFYHTPDEMHMAASITRDCLKAT